MCCIGAVLTSENFAHFFQRQQTTNLAGLAVAAHATQPSAKQDSRDAVLKHTAPFVVVP